MPNVKIKNGYLIPDVQTVRDLLGDFSKQLKTDTKLKVAYTKNPRKVLGNLGLSGPVVSDILREEGRRVSGPSAMICGMTGCACTGCCFTTIS